MIIPTCPNCEACLLDVKAGVKCSCCFSEHTHFKASCDDCGACYDVLYYIENDLLEIIEY